MGVDTLIGLRQIPFSYSSAAVLVIALGCGGRATSQHDTNSNDGSGGNRDDGTIVSNTGGAIQTLNSSSATRLLNSNGGQSTQTTPASTGTGGAVVLSTVASTTGATTTSVSCAKVTCPALPNACTRLVQASDQCCPTCVESACQPCAPLDCVAGTHLETVVGDCCPSCVADPPNQCEKDRASYASAREALLSKYGSVGCSSSPDCTIVAENNGCTWSCGIPIAKSMQANLENNLVITALCSSCPPPPPLACERMVPACLNGTCVAADPE